MLSVYRASLSKAQPAFRSATQVRWSSTDGEDNTPKKSTADISTIFNILNDASDRNKDNLNEALRNSVHAEKQKNASNDATSDFDMSALAQHLSHVSQEFHQLHINASPNNTILTLTRPNGSPLITTSGGSAGFKKAARSGYEAAHQAAIQLLEKKQAKNLQVNNIHVILKGFGAGREAAFKALVSGDKWNVKRLTDATPVPFGGCRPKKARRL
ncbi:hypothetical protein BJV82DRAFT_633216 [Fennellomyces sp. T-0311]|nr:hypothetical protein BJV82DRAFT_633216 [Fennellomyces sp. T-0311]